MANDRLNGLWTLVITLLAGCPHPSNTSRRQSIDPCVLTSCPGSNSPISNGFPVNGLSTAGVGISNPSGIRLLPHSLRGGGCGVDADLTIDSTSTRLIGVRDSQVVCEVDRLVGASFSVRSEQGAIVDFSIASVTRSLRNSGRDGYRIEAAGGSACNPSKSTQLRQALGLPHGADGAMTVGGFHARPDDDLVIVVGGPLYDVSDRTIAGTSGRFFTLACVGDALAKRSLYGLFDEDEAKNESALRLLTANYCGKPYTMRGMPLLMSNRRPGARLEARWRAGQALCISRPRLTNAGVSTRSLPPPLQPSGCQPRQGENQGRCDVDEWVEALRAECNLNECPAESEADFETYTP